MIHQLFSSLLATFSIYLLFFIFEMQIPYCHLNMKFQALTSHSKGFLVLVILHCLGVGFVLNLAVDSMYFVFSTPAKNLPLAAVLFSFITLTPHTPTVCAFLIVQSQQLNLLLLIWLLESRCQHWLNQFSFFVFSILYLLLWPVFYLLSLAQQGLILSSLIDLFKI